KIEEELGRNGFKQSGDNVTPDILLTVLYGRGYLKNPYADNNTDAISSGVKSVTLTTPEQVAMHLQLGYEEKLQHGEAEKLFLAVRAWQYPKQRGEKPKALWQCSMLLDNPEANDLNDVAAAMLQSGVRHFDKDLDRGGIIVTSDRPAGRVILAPLKVLEDEKPAPTTTPSEKK
ncbi:MAG: hypothetical protein ABIV50_06180, partial [Opitutus sp.]